MAQVLTKPAVEPTDGHIDLDFRNPESWRPFAEGKGVTVLFGDDEVGPFAFFSSFEPSDEQMPLSFSHAHPSDNWRISVRGTTNMGRDAYTEGQFRYHDGGVPYASDNVAWGPDGGFGFVMFGDRRGFPIRPVSKKLADKIIPEQAAIGARLGIDVKDPCPGAPAIATTLGQTERAHLDGGFESAPTWPEVADGVRVSLGLLGEPERGPVIMLVDAAPGAEVLPDRSIGTEVVLMPISGRIDAGDTTLEQGSIRIEEAGSSAAPLTAAETGAQLVVVVGNRQALLQALRSGSFGGTDYVGSVEPLLAGLQTELTPAGP